MNSDKVKRVIDNYAALSRLGFTHEEITEMLEKMKAEKSEKPELGDRVAVLVIMWMERAVYGKDAVQLAKWGVEPREMKVEC